MFSLYKERRRESYARKELLSYGVRCGYLPSLEGKHSLWRRGNGVKNSRSRGRVGGREWHLVLAVE